MSSQFEQPYTHIHIYTIITPLHHDIHNSQYFICIYYIILCRLKQNATYNLPTNSSPTLKLF